MLANMDHELYQQLAEVKLLPLYTVTDLDCLDKLEEVLVKNDVRFIEVAFRSDLAAEAIKRLAVSGELIVGAGTVRTLAEAKVALENGAKFVVSPAIVPEVIDYCIERDVPVFPGTATPGDIQRAMEYGINVVKFFPADIYGGLKAIKALSGPFYDVKFLPTGGINQENFMEYLENDHIIGVGGSFIISEALLKKDDGKSADENLRELVARTKG
ncbi:bifunctional 4-hydroxy-2-oxoglutarate aldolase/2-dehydro-3-deoxy-phosphogluconate aldolase [Enterococcus pallens]|uniref:2-dehydro-3-deoxyphosphogluconate aldolase/4-hydroxy-2-oxoglutarate aldolase n=1 Tax=Enterococcus pallens ATCC BAA-351 TaxID=1158607 RepID=R2TBZ4_9ENTE|nr:bifunctional 4-hydroxy-2-oxoglutarate aldolase/2-dehydro-3-deoxy-phosphogluconate aldolase [Enterococcus pallens]EOH97759.1 2-dehydro-3-deoxyphosphogluconate aldolase/4-hydroxy-2-oxoglutarate aldolase [Enterococcus pallens ATCC BAA-351]EOU20822.1 2-dehydro-3-deoxyphosphogluconate aldolase/4-hydroxy-2-oxoglutarate aldolase [Enterococcus pallens ATCC BAA-351]OJG76179.1 2-dehydro-3-deoxyphosphogluconate aldolase/4-hydroxy-2-oxoglutarate aldolase [Enterococcus pallens]